VWEGVKDIDEVFARTRILLVPSLYQEGFGLVATEAMLRGIPVLASDHGGLRDAKLGIDYLVPIRPIVEYEARYDDRHYPIPVVPEQDVRPWLEALQCLLSDPEHYARLSKASRDAALAFVAGLASEPFEKFLRDLSDATSSAGVQEGSASTDQAGDGSERELRSRIASLSPERRALLARRLRKHQAASE
jgi:glycosyltransferase involved in cell wall biosynthesis